MKFLIVGGGSMGRRRMRCLLANDVQSEQIRVVDVREDRRAEALDRHGVAGFDNLDDGLSWEPDVVIVSVPPAMHMEVLLPAARARRHVFCEVPLAMGLDGIDELAELAEEKDILIAPGIQTAFHPLVRQIKHWLAAPAFGRLLAINQDWGQWLPDWHPYEDYRTFYAAKQDQGGAALDILGHEAATFYWLMDDRVDRLICRGDRLSTLEIDGNDYWQILAVTRDGVRMTLQYDLIQRAVHNSLRFISETGTIELEIGGSVSAQARARQYLVSTGEWEEVRPPDGYDYEQCYIDEITHLIRCVRGEAKWLVSLEAALGVVRFLTASLESAREQQWTAV